MKKRYKKLPRYWLGTKKPTSLGYQPNYGIGGVLFSTTPGEDVNPETRTVKSNTIPSALDKLTQHGGTAINVLSDRANTFRMLTGTASRTVPTAASAMAASNASALTAGGVGARLTALGADAGKSYLGNMFTTGTLNMLETGASTGGKAVTSSALGTAGTVLGAIGTLYGLGDMGNQWLHLNDHRSVGEMRNTQAINTYTTDMGNTYTQRGGINSSAELDYARATKRAKQLNFGATSLGTGLAAGATIGAIAGSEVPVVGTIIGGAAGALLGGAAALLGFGDTEEEVKKQMDKINDVTGLENRQSKTYADSLDIYQGFYKDRAGAAEGKQPLVSPRGYAEGKADSMVSHGEVLGEIDPKTKTITNMFRVPGTPDTKDTVKAKGINKPNAFAITNLGGLSELAANGHPYEALGLQALFLDMKILKKYGENTAKCGKLPHLWAGTPTQTILASIPHLGAIYANWLEANRLKNASTSTPIEPIDDLGASNIAALMEGDLLSMYPYEKLANNLFRQSNWAANRQVGLGYGGREVEKANLFRNMLGYLGDTQTKINEINKTQRNAARELKFKNALDLRNLKHDSWWKRESERLAKIGALNNLRSQIPLNLYNVGSSWAGNLSNILQHDRAMNIEQQKANDLGYKYRNDAQIQKDQIANLAKWINFAKTLGSV